MNSTTNKLLPLALIVLGGITVVYQQNQPQKEQTVWILAIGFAVLMFGLFKATRGWVQDNPRPDADTFVVTEQEKDPDTKEQHPKK